METQGKPNGLGNVDAGNQENPHQAKPAAKKIQTKLLVDENEFPEGDVPRGTPEPKKETTEKPETKTQGDEGNTKDDGKNGNYWILAILAVIIIGYIMLNKNQLEDGNHEAS